MDMYRPIPANDNESATLKLYFKGNEIGLLSAVESDFPWMSGHVQL